MAQSLQFRLKQITPVRDLMLISIVTPTFNSIRFINSTYLTIANQSHENWEWVVTDDCSSDGTYEYLCELARKDHRIKVFRNESNAGAAVSRNNCLSNAKGDYISFLDADDLWSSNKLEIQSKYMATNAVDFSFTAYKLIDESGDDLGQTVDTHQTGPLTYHDMLRKKATLGCSTVMMKASTFQDYRMPLLRTGQDYAFWLKILKNGYNAYPIPNVLMHYRIVSDSISRNKFKKAKRQWQIYREIEKLNIFESLFNFYCYAYRAVFRR